MEFQQVELRTNFEALAKLCRSDAEKRWNSWIVAGVDQIHRPGKALAVGQRVKGQAVFGGGHKTLYHALRAPSLVRRHRAVGQIVVEEHVPVRLKMSISDIPACSIIRLSCPWNSFKPH